MKNKFWMIVGGMLIAAVAEVSVTAFLVERLGVMNLIGAYIVTTAIGFLFVWMYRLKQKKISEKLINTDMSSFSEDREEMMNDPRAQYFAEIGMSFGFFLWAVILIVIPGVVTDAIGLVMLICWAASSTVRNFDPAYEPKL